MKTKGINKNNGVLLIILVLFLSLVFNIYSSLLNTKYKKIISKDAYNHVEEIRHRNESILSILNEGITSGSIAHEQLLMLYKNSNAISDAAVQLWSDYGTKDEEENILPTKKALKTEPANNDVYLRVQNLIFEYLNMEMKSGTEKLILDEKILSNFKEIQSMAQQIQTYYVEFTNAKLKDLNEEQKKEMIIKKGYWVDIIKGINEIIKPYVNYPFAV